MSSPSDSDESGDVAHPQLERRLERRRLQVFAQFYAVVLQFLVFLSATFIPLLVIVLLEALEYLISPMPVITFSPWAIAMGGSGLLVTQAIQTAAISVVAKRLYDLIFKGYPRAEVSDNQNTNSGGQR